MIREIQLGHSAFYITSEDDRIISETIRLPDRSHDLHYNRLRSLSSINHYGTFLCCYSPAATQQRIGLEQNYTGLILGMSDLLLHRSIVVHRCLQQVYSDVEAGL